MEMLQCVKCAIRHDLLFREPAPSSILEVETDDDEDEGWDELLLGDEDVAGGARIVGTDTDKDTQFSSD